MEYIRKGIDNLDNELADRLRTLLYSAQIESKSKEAKQEDFQKVVGDRFEDTVTRGKVWYKRKMQNVGILCGVLLAFTLNADTISISNALWHNAVLRESIAQAAQAAVQQQLDDFMNLGLPLGWAFDANPGNPRAFPATTGGWLAKSVGLLLTGFAISQGSQIWFDLMNRLINLRSTGLKSDSEEEPAKDKGK